MSHWVTNTTDHTGPRRNDAAQEELAPMTSDDVIIDAAHLVATRVPLGSRINETVILDVPALQLHDRGGRGVLLVGSNLAELRGALQLALEALEPDED